MNLKHSLTSSCYYWIDKLSKLIANAFYKSFFINVDDDESLIKKEYFDLLMNLK